MLFFQAYCMYSMTEENECGMQQLQLIEQGSGKEDFFLLQAS
jgi:hypothetical protein